ncbi:hypothetical protein GCM10017779_47420 [Streptomyces capillispiralis]|nr:hypothetical protein GCM10017779_47420 [Streptomyces capillispiralis]
MTAMQAPKPLRNFRVFAAEPRREHTRVPAETNRRNTGREPPDARRPTPATGRRAGRGHQISGGRTGCLRRILFHTGQASGLSQPRTGRARDAGRPRDAERRGPAAGPGSDSQLLTE